MALSPTGTKSSTQRTNSQWPRWWASVSTCQKGDRNSSLRCRTSACSWPSRLGTSWWGESLSHTSPLPSPAPFEPQTLQERLERGIQLPICNHSDEKHEADTSWRAEVSSFAERITATTFWTPRARAANAMKTSTTRRSIPTSPRVLRPWQSTVTLLANLVNFRTTPLTWQSEKLPVI